MTDKNKPALTPEDMMRAEQVAQAKGLTIDDAMTMMRFMKVLNARGERRDRIDAGLKALGLSRRDVARALGLDHTIMVRVLNGTLRRLPAEAMEVLDSTIMQEVEDYIGDVKRSRADAAGQEADAGPLLGRAHVVRLVPRAG